MWVNFNSVCILCITEEHMFYLQMQEVVQMNIKCDQLCSSLFCVWGDHFSNLGQEILDCCFSWFFSAPLFCAEKLRLIRP